MDEKMDCSWDNPGLSSMLDIPCYRGIKMEAREAIYGTHDIIIQYVTAESQLIRVYYKRPHVQKRGEKLYF
jgi:hypothetical protein